MARASLKFIMDMGDEEPEPQIVKKDHDLIPPGTSHGLNPSSSGPSSHATSGDTDDNQTPASSRRRGPTSRQSKSTPDTTTSSSSATSQPRTDSGRHLSDTSNESMDPVGYGGLIGGGSNNMAPSNTPIMRPMGNVSNPDIPIKYTPITGRVSRAKKGVPVHTCEICRPAKTFTRAEHLRRHQLSHQTPQFVCSYPGCDRSFHRADLLARHASRHEQEGGERMPSRDNHSRRTSEDSTESGTPRIAYRGQRPPMRDSPTSHASLQNSMGDGPTSVAYPPARSYSSMSNHGSASAPMSPPQHRDRRGSYQSTSSNPSQGPGGGYILSNQPQLAALHSHSASGSSSPAHQPGFNPLSYSQPRTSSPFPIFVASTSMDLPSLTIPDTNPPGLLAPRDASPAWASGSESNFSTPSESQRRNWNSGYHSPTPADWATGSVAPPYPPTLPQDLRSNSSGLDLAAAPPFYNAFSPVTPHTSSYDPLMHMPLYNEEHTIFDPHQHPYSSVRSPTSPTMTSAQPSENLVTLAPSIPDVGLVGRYKDSPTVLSTYSNTAFLSTVTLPRAVRIAIPGYLEVYWRRFDTLFPVVHRQSFENAPDDVLRCAMAAMATQFLNGKEDRIKGNQLHEFAWQEVRRRPQWNVSIMQAILLCEFYARFRGRKAVVRPSQPFQSLYSRVVGNAHSGPISNEFTYSGDTTRESSWAEWIDAESRRRLLSATFVLEVHTSVYHEQPFLQHFNTPTPPIPLVKASVDLWAAATAGEWELRMNSPSIEPSFLSEEVITPERIAVAPPLDRAVFLSSEMLRLPRRSSPSALDLNKEADLSVADRISHLFPQDPVGNTYLALHYTPLHDLLAVSGDSWLFTQKVLPSTTFQQHQKRLKVWSTTLHAAAAARFAAQALIAFLEPNNSYNINQLDDGLGMEQGRRTSVSDISDYWAMYVCALICWALSHRTARGSTGVTSAAGSATAMNNVGEHEALAWLRVLAVMSPEEILHVRGRREIVGVVSMVKRRLEVEAVGLKSRLLVDALGVLKKLEEGVNWRWF